LEKLTLEKAAIQKMGDWSKKCTTPSEGSQIEGGKEALGRNVLTYC